MVDGSSVDILEGGIASTCWDIFSIWHNARIDRLDIGLCQLPISKTLKKQPPSHVALKPMHAIELQIAVDGCVELRKVGIINAIQVVRNWLQLAQVPTEVTGFGARYAGGCTSGHAISGLSDLQLPSLIAVIGFFIGGLTVTYLVLPHLLAL